MTGAITSAFERDPDLDPIVPPAGAQAIPVAQPRSQARRRAVVEPAEPLLWSLTVPLQYPVLVDGVRLDEITIRRLTGADVAELLIEDDAEDTLNARARALMCGLAPEVLTGLVADDSEKVAVACRPFLPRSLRELEALDDLPADAAAEPANSKPLA